MGDLPPALFPRLYLAAKALERLDNEAQDVVRLQALGLGAKEGRADLPDDVLQVQPQVAGLFLEGNVDLQIASLWAYLKDLKNQPLPEKILTARSQNLRTAKTTGSATTGLRQL